MDFLDGKQNESKMVAPASAASAHLNCQVKLEDAAKAGATCKTLLNQFLAAQLDRIIGLFAGGVFGIFFKWSFRSLGGKTK